MFRYSLSFFVALFLALSTAGEATAQDQYFDSNGVQIHYRDRGAGEPVVLLHGFTNEQNRTWEQTGVAAALLEAGYRVVTYDSRGHGRSDKPHDPDGYGVKMVDDLGRLLNHLEVEQAHVVGYSMGARIAHRFRTLHPEHFLSLTLGGYGWGHVGLAELSRNPTESDIQARLDANGRWEGNDAIALAAVYSSLPEWDLSEEEIRSNQVPTLIINGDEDERKLFAEKMLGVMPNLSHVLVSGTHGSATSDPRFAAELIGFLESNPSN